MFIENLNKIIQDPPCLTSYTTQLLLGRLELDHDQINEESCVFYFKAGQESFGATGLLESAIIYTASSKCLSAHLWALYGDPGVEISANLIVIQPTTQPSTLQIKTRILHRTKKFIFTEVEIYNDQTLIAKFITQRYFSK